MIKVLIADDEYMEREMLLNILEKRFGAEVTVRQAVNGSQAVDVATLWEADVALLDIEMPCLNGLDAAQKIIAQRPDCKLIFITAYSFFSYAQEAVKLGACDYILKPVDDSEVERAIRRAIGQTETHRQLTAMAPEARALPEGSDKTAALMSRVQKYMQHNFTRFDISLDSVSRLLGINSSYLSTAFKRCTGVNFIDYLTDLRLSAAKELLLDPLRSTQEIAGMVGYDSPSYFTRAFKKRTGLTPTEYRRGALREKEETSV